jgi:hypothetical protein
MTTALQVRISYFVYTVAGEANFEAHLWSFSVTRVLIQCSSWRRWAFLTVKGEWVKTFLLN